MKIIIFINSTVTHIFKHLQLLTRLSHLQNVRDTQNVHLLKRRFLLQQPQGGTVEQWLATTCPVCIPPRWLTMSPEISQAGIPNLSAEGTCRYIVSEAQTFIDSGLSEISSRARRDVRESRSFRETINLFLVPVL